MLSLINLSLHLCVQCGSGCGLNNETRSVLCVSQKGKVVEDEYCSEARKPETSRPCADATECEYRWYASEWSAVSSFTNFLSSMFACSLERNIILGWLILMSDEILLVMSLIMVCYCFISYMGMLILVFHIIFVVQNYICHSYHVCNFDDNFSVQWTVVKEYKHVMSSVVF